MGSSLLMLVPFAIYLYFYLGTEKDILIQLALLIAVFICVGFTIKNALQFINIICPRCGNRFFIATNTFIRPGLGGAIGCAHCGLERIKRQN